MAYQGTVTVRCPDGVERQAQISSNTETTTRLSVRVGGRRVHGYLGDANTFVPSGTGRNGNPFRYMVTA